MSGTYIAIFLMIFVIIQVQRKQKFLALRQILRSRQKKEKNQMNELAKRFIGKECLIYTYDQHQFVGTVREVGASAMLIDNAGSEEAINLDYISRIREYPRKKNGKKKSVVLD